jgi:hypothetical protein
MIIITGQEARPFAESEKNTCFIITLFCSFKKKKKFTSWLEQVSHSMVPMYIESLMEY